VKNGLDSRVEVVTCILMASRGPRMDIPVQFMIEGKVLAALRLACARIF